MSEQQAADRSQLLSLTTEIVTAQLSSSSFAGSEIPGLIQSVYDTLAALAGGQASTPQVLTPAVPVKRSVTADYIVCLEDGKKLKMLKRHLLTAYGMTPEQYRAKWSLPHDYPMVAPNYSLRRQELAKAIGLGRKPDPVPPAKRGRAPRGRAKAA